MATSTSINIITGRTGTAHVSSGDDAAIWRGLVGSGNVTLTTDNDLNLDYSTKGTLVLSTGVFCMNGRMGRIDDSTALTYGLPVSGRYRRTILLVRYSLDSGTGIESMSLMTLQSDSLSDATSAASASELPITTGETDYVLYDFVCGEDGVVTDTLTSKMTIVNGIQAVNALYTLLGIRVESLETGASNEATARANADTALGNRVTSLETWKSLENSTTYKLVRVDGPSQTDYGRQDIICEPAVRSSHVMANGEGQHFYRYTVLLDPTGTSATVSFNGISGGSANVIGSVKIVGS